MLLRRVLGCAALPALLCSVTQQAAAQSYLLVNAGVSTNHVEFLERRNRTNRNFEVDTFDTRDHGNSAVVSAGFGTHFQSNLRGEVVVSYRPEYSSRIDSQTSVVESGARTRLRSLSAIASLYYDFPVSWWFKPYVGGGLGLANNRFSVDPIVLQGGNTVAGSSETNNHFAWQLGGGFTYEMGPLLVLDLGYRYFDGGNLGFDQKLRAQEVQVGIRLRLQ